jgi:2-oxoisovalerate dehydrogenase E1 component beta subunit
VDEGFEHLDAPVRRLTGLDVPGVPFSHPMQEHFMPSVEKIVHAVRELAGY